jgi:Rieske Fe-S protein
MDDSLGASSPVIVIGTGPAGLAAAMALTRSGVPVRIVERSDLLGGKVNSHKESGHSLEHGVHGWWMNYLNFDRLLRWADVVSADVFKEAEGSVLLTPDGERHPLQTLSLDLPSPLFFVLQILRSTFLSFSDLIRTIPFGIHALAFKPEYDYQRYDGFSFQNLMDATGVSPKIQKLLFEPFILSFDFTTPDRVSAACGLSGLQFYVLRDQHSIISRWPKGLPAEVIFGPIAAKIERQGANFSLSTTLQSIVIEDNKVTGVRLEEKSNADLHADSPAPNQILAEVELSKIPATGFTEVTTSSGAIWVGRETNDFLALSARCTHEGCAVDWKQEQASFVCPCHGGRFSNHGEVLQGPPKLPLDKLSSQVKGDKLQVFGQALPEAHPCSDIILATDLESAKRVVAQTEGLQTNLRHNIGHLDTTPVLVIRIWFKEGTMLEPDIESAITPTFPFIDNFFHLNSFNKEIGKEGHVIEVQVYHLAGAVIDANDETILTRALSDLELFNSDYVRENVTFFTINRHRALFTRYGPGQNPFRPTEESGTEGLHLAGDWTQSPRNVWMMERGVVSGLKAANSVLQRRGLPEVEILQLPPEHPFLKLSRFISLLLRLIFFRRLPMNAPPSEDELNAHLVRDHQIVGWVFMTAAAFNFLPLFSPDFAVLLKIWPLMVIGLSLVVLFHTDPDVRFTYGSWLRAWSDTATFQHRILSIGSIVTLMGEVAIVYNHWDLWYAQAAYPTGLIAAGIIFYGHHHGSSGLINRQHAIMAFLFIVTGLTWLAARFIPLLEPLKYSWPMLFGILGYMFITHKQQDDHVHDPGHEGDGHDHVHVDA